MNRTALGIEGLCPSLTSQLNRAEIETFASALTPVELPAGAELIREGDASDTLYIVSHGSLIVSMRTAGGERELGRLEVGDIVGEVSVMDPGPASATVTADGRTQLLQITHAALDGLAESNPNVAMAILHSLCSTVADRIAESNRRCDAVSREIDPQTSLVGASPLPGLRDFFKILFGRSGS